jgi:hypothetical protein
MTVVCASTPRANRIATTLIAARPSCGFAGRRFSIASRSVKLTGVDFEGPVALGDKSAKHLRVLRNKQRPEYDPAMPRTS